MRHILHKFGDFLREEHGFLGGIFRGISKLFAGVLGQKAPQAPPPPPPPPAPPPPPPAAGAAQSRAAQTETLTRQRDQQARRHRTLLSRRGGVGTPFGAQPLGGSGKLG